MAFLRFSCSFLDFSMASSISFDILVASCWRAMRACFSCRDSDCEGLKMADQASSSCAEVIMTGRMRRRAFVAEYVNKDNPTTKLVILIEITFANYSHQGSTCPLPADPPLSTVVVGGCKCESRNRTRSRWFQYENEVELGHSGSFGMPYVSRRAT